MTKKPGIVIVSKDTDDIFNWLSDGWYGVKQQSDPAAQALYAKAHAAIEAATDVQDAIRRLQEAGFDVRRAEEEEKPRFEEFAKLPKEVVTAAVETYDAMTGRLVSLWQLAPDAAAYGDHAGWWIFVTPDSRDELAGIWETEDEAREYAAKMRWAIVPLED